MSGAGRRVFVYHRARIALYVIFMVLPLAVFPVGFWRFETTHDALGWSIIAILSLSILSLTAAYRFVQERPIAVSGERIETFLCGRPWRTIAWSDVERIEKRLMVAADAGEVVYDVIRFRAGRRTIAVTSWIGEFAALKQLATEEAKRRGIEIVATRPHAFWRPPIVTPLDEL